MRQPHAKESKRYSGYRVIALTSVTSKCTHQTLFFNAGKDTGTASMVKSARGREMG